jgi:hypothetical protein
VIVSGADNADQTPDRGGEADQARRDAAEGRGEAGGAGPGRRQGEQGERCELTIGLFRSTHNSSFIQVLRRKAGQDLTKIKEDMELKEMQKAADQKKREKLADAKARAATKADIEVSPQAAHG